MSTKSKKRGKLNEVTQQNIEKFQTPNLQNIFIKKRKKLHQKFQQKIKTH